MLTAGAGTAERAAEMIERARVSLAAARTPEERLAALGRASQAEEAALAALRSRLRAAADRRAEIETGLASERRRLIAVISALQRIESAPRAVALAHPDGVVAGARAGMLLSALAPNLEREAARLEALLKELQDLDRRIGAATAESRGALEALQKARAEISSLLDRGGDAGAVDGQAELERLARSVKTLKALAQALPASNVREEPGGARFTAARGALTPPVEGRLAARFGEQLSSGPLQGVRIETPPYAAVYAPWRGVIRFAGPFAREGVVVMLEPEPDILIVMSGLSSALKSPGDVVLAGELIGAMSGPPPDAEEFLMDATSVVETSRSETLYMEVRRGGTPMDPATWFALEQEEGETQ